jgi:hypothetical protein
MGPTGAFLEFQINGGAWYTIGTFSYAFSAPTRRVLRWPS